VHDVSSHTCVHQVSLSSCFNCCVCKMDIPLQTPFIYLVDAVVEACLASGGPVVFLLPC
jgi:hypothetical protein